MQTVAARNLSITQTLLFSTSATTSEPNTEAFTWSLAQTDQNGIYSSNVLPPGKHYTLASTTQVDFTPEK